MKSGVKFNGKLFNIPVVSWGVQSCSPVAPQRRVFDGVDVVVGAPNEEFRIEIFRFFRSEMSNFGNFLAKILIKSDKLKFKLLDFENLFFRLKINLLD